MSGFLSAGIVGGPDIPDSVVSQYDTQALSGFNDGDTINTLPDEQNGFDLSGAAAYRSNGINGHPSIEFDGSQQFSNSTPTLTQPYTVISVAEITGNTGNDHTVFDSDNNNFSLLRYSNGEGNRTWFAGRDIGLASPDTNPHISTALADGANSVLRFDAVQEGSGDAGSNSIDGFQLGQSYDDSRGLVGYIGEVLIYDSLLTQSEYEIAPCGTSNCSSSCSDIALNSGDVVVVVLDDLFHITIRVVGSVAASAIRTKITDRSGAVSLQMTLNRL